MAQEFSELEQAFLADASEQLGVFEEELLNLETNPNDPEIINKIFRAAHTLKGSAGFAGYREVESFSHHAENLLDLLRNHTLAVNEEILQLLLESRDVLSDMVQCRLSGKTFANRERTDAIEERMHKWTHGEEKPHESTHHDEPKHTQKLNHFRLLLEFNEGLFETGTDPLMILEDLSQSFHIVSSSLIVKKIPPIENLDPFKNYLNWQIVISGTSGREELDTIFLFVSVDNKITIEPIRPDELSITQERLGEILVQKGFVGEEEIEKAMEQHNPIGKDLIRQGAVTRKIVDQAVSEQQKVRTMARLSTVRIDTGKLDELIDTVGEVVVAKSRIRSMMERKGWLELEEEALLVELDRYVEMLQTTVMKTRMVPVKETFVQFRRMVRDLSHQQQKEVEFEIVGEDTELDKNVIEKLKDPLKHMVRNSIDHGIESPAERQRLGKPSPARLTLKAYHEGGEVVIEVLDDGRGLDRDRILQKALERGLVESTQEITDSEIFRFILQPGFSTAERITDISGRGVGMDVVQSNLASIRGSIHIQSEPGKGTAFRIAIPLTLAIIDGILIRVGSNFFVIPIHSVTEFLTLDQEALIDVKGAGKALPFREKFIPVVHLGELFGFQKTPATMLTVVQSSNQFLGLQVDEIVGKYQVVIKSLEENFQKVEFISGATLLGDGSIAMILDINALVQKKKAHSTT